MTGSSAIAAYTTFYVDMHLERLEVLKAVQGRIGRATVLYPGCAIHIAPSYFFQHVVYIDRHPAAAKFFEEEREIADYVAARKQYKQAPYMRFIAQDFTAALPLREDSFDLLLALHAGGIAEACCMYLKPGGLLLSNNHHDDAGHAARSGHYALVAAIYLKRDACQFSGTDLDAYFIPRARRARLRQHDLTPRYTRNADYYLFTKQ